MNKISLNDLNVQFVNIDSFFEEGSSALQPDDQALSFGPSKVQTKSFSSWNGFDGRTYYPYNQTEGIGKISDFISAAAAEAREDQRKLVQQAIENRAMVANQLKKDEGTKEKKRVRKPIIEEKKVQPTTAEANLDDAEDDGFTTVADKQYRGPKKTQQQNWKSQQNWKQQQEQKDSGQEKVNYKGPIDKKAITKKAKFASAYFKSNYQKQLRCNLRDNSIDTTDFELLPNGELNISDFNRLSPLRPVFLSNVRECGEIQLYDSKWNNCTGKKPQVLNKFEGFTPNVRLFDDEIMIELIKEEVADIYTTDEVAALLMQCSKSNYSWDIEIKNYNNIIFLDKRKNDATNNILNFDTVCENALDHQPMDQDNINGIKSLMKESRDINNSWLHSGRAQDMQPINLETDNKFIEDEHQEATRIGYVYRIWKIQEANEQLGLKEKRICIRCQVHSHTGQRNDKYEFRKMNLFAFNEHNQARTNWRRDIDSNNVMKLVNAEIAANSFKASRWITQCLLADVDFINFALVTRKSMTDPSKGHQVLASLRSEVMSWAKQMNMSLDRGWRTIQHICEIVLADTKPQPVGEGEEPEDIAADYVLLKDFAAQKLSLFRKPEVEDEEEEEEDDTQIKS